MIVMIIDLIMVKCAIPLKFDPSIFSVKATEVTTPSSVIFSLKTEPLLTDWMTFDTFLFLVDIQRPFDIFNNNSSSLNGL